MTHTQFRAALDKVGLSQMATARLLDAGPRTVRAWALDEAPIPNAVAILLRLLVQQKISIEDVEKVK